jgi:hypothetical protein
MATKMREARATDKIKGPNRRNKYQIKEDRYE